MEYTSHSLEETLTIAKKLINDLTPGSTLALYGDLGAGKTAFVQNIGKVLKVETPIVSPTFLLMKTYPTQHHTIQELIHLDLYRIQNWDDITELNLEEYWQNKEKLVVIEWADRIEEHLPPSTVRVTFEHIGPEERKISFSTN